MNLPYRAVVRVKFDDIHVTDSLNGASVASYFHLKPQGARYPLFPKSHETHVCRTFLGTSYQVFSYPIPTPSASISRRLEFENDFLEQGETTCLFFSAFLGKEQRDTPLVLIDPACRDLGFLPEAVSGI